MENKELKLVIYLRVSTKEQGKSGLGLLAQEQDINYKIIQLQAKGNNVSILETFKDIASGKSRNNRNGLDQALKMCKEHGAYLIFQKLDRLSRNIRDGINIYDELNKKMFIAQWEQIDSFSFNIRLCIAEQERELISERTKKALNELKKQGVKLGRRWDKDEHGNIIKGQNTKAVKSMLKVRQENNKNYYKKINILIVDYRKQNYSYRKIANKLTELDYKTIKGNIIGIHTVNWLVKKYNLFN